MRDVPTHVTLDTLHCKQKKSASAPNSYPLGHISQGIDHNPGAGQDVAASERCRELPAGSRMSRAGRTRSGGRTVVALYAGWCLLAGTGGPGRGWGLGDPFGCCVLATHATAANARVACVATQPSPPLAGTRPLAGAGCSLLPLSIEEGLDHQTQLASLVPTAPLNTLESAPLGNSPDGSGLS